MNNEAGVKRDGGSVYPMIEFMDKIRHLDAGEYIQTRGLSLRDHFAGLAMQGFLITPVCMNGVVLQFSVEKVSELSYLMADAMLKARDA